MLPVVDIPWSKVDLKNPQWQQSLVASAEYKSAVQLFSREASWSQSLVSWEGLALLYSLVRSQRPETVVEIGSFKGWTAQVLARALHANGRGTVHTVGPFDTERFLPLYDQWPDELKQRCKFHPLMSMDFFVHCEHERMRFDIVFVDGNHDYEYAMFDIQSAARCMNPGGCIIVDNISQSGPYYAVLDFLAQQPEWDDCGTRPKPLTNRPFDAQRSTVYNTDFVILRAPEHFSVGDRAVTFGEMPWKAAPVNGIELTVAASDCRGVLHSQCVLRGFGQNDAQEIAAAGSIDITTVTGKTRIAFTKPLQARTFDRYTVELWFVLEGHGRLHLSCPPELF